MTTCPNCGLGYEPQTTAADCPDCRARGIVVPSDLSRLAAREQGIKVATSAVGSGPDDVLPFDPRGLYDPIADQPPPKPGRGDMGALVIEDMKQRRADGIERYGTPLQCNNGRRMLVDAYQEVLDLAVYLRGEIEERRELEAEVLQFRARLAEVELERDRLAAILDHIRGGARLNAIAEARAEHPELFADTTPDMNPPPRITRVKP